MNRIFKVIWNAQLQVFIVASEFAKGYCRSAKVSSDAKHLLMGIVTPLAAGLLYAPSINAADLTFYGFSPSDPTEITVSGTDNTLTGSFANVQNGSKGFKNITLGQAQADGLLGWNGDLVGQYDLLKMGSQEKSINYTDPLTGTNLSMKVFNSDNFLTASLSDFVVAVSVAVGKDGQYVDRNLYNINDGGSLNVNVGSTAADWMNQAENHFSAILKSSVKDKNNTSVFLVSSTGSDASLNYNAKTVVQLGNKNNNFKGNETSIANAVLNKYTGTFSSVLGQQTVTSLDEFIAYNNALVAALQNGEIHMTEAEYAAELNKARDTKAYPIYTNNDSIPADDAVKAQVNRDAVSFIHASGAGAVVNIDVDANIQLLASDAALVNLEDGATLVNNGTLGTTGNTLQGAYVVSTRSGSVLQNNGVIDAGTNNEMLSANNDVAAGMQTGIMANGTSVVNNNATGIINLATSSSQNSNDGVILGDTAAMTNNGTLNVAATTQVTTQGTPVTTGIKATQQSALINNGLIYIGREAQRNATDVAQDLRISSKSVGVQVSDSATYTSTADSKIVIGSLTSDARALSIESTSTSSPVVDQKGTIDINGAVSGTSAANIGISVGKGTSLDSVTNSGVINLNGIYGIGIDIANGGKITHTGIINVNGGPDPVSAYPNYGIRTDGTGSQANVSGIVNLTGNNAIGIYTLNNGEIDVTGDGAVNFLSGKNQTGFYIYGAGSSLSNSATSVQNVSTEDSTLYRIDGGAIFNGSASLTSQLIASGLNATIIRTTGAGSQFDSGKLNFSVTGENATAVRVEGGAAGTISADTVISLAGKNTTAGVVDGQYYALDGTAIDAAAGDSVLTSYAVLETANTAADAFGYIARNGGRLIHHGAINFTAADSTGVLIDGGILENHADISVNGVAVNIQGENSEVTNSGTVTATDGTAAYLVGNGASLSLDGAGLTQAAGSAHGILLASGAKGLTVDGATISMASSGTGNAIENVAGIGGIQLKDTTINVGNGIGVHTGASLAQTNSGIINVNGSGTGILFEGLADGSDTDQMLDTSDSAGLVINVNAADGHGIVTRSTADLKTGVSVNVLNKDGKAALVVEGTTQNVAQSGVLTSISEQSAVVDIVSHVLEAFTNTGRIEALDAAHKALERLEGAGITLINAAGASIVGQVNLLSGDNTVILESGSSATDITSGAGADRFILKDIQAEDSATLFTSLNGGAGDDTLQVENSIYTLSSAKAISSIEHISLSDNSVFTLDKVSLALGDDGQDATGTGYQIDASSTLQLKSAADLTFNSHIAGEGTLAIDASGHQVSFSDNNAGDGFTGTVALSNSLYELGGNNALALSDATLLAGSGSEIHVTEGEQRIGGLAFAGGTVKFDGVTPGESAASGIIRTLGMDLAGRGVIQVDTGSVSNDRPQAETHRAILEQDDGEALITLATSDTAVQGGAGNLVLHDKDGHVITDAVTAAIAQDGLTVANGTYDYRLTSGDSNDGLYISYGLTQVELLTRGNQALILDAAGKTGNGADLSAKITGSGDLAFDSLAGETVTLSNMDNDYTGVTDVRSGNLAMLNDGVLGNSSELKLAADSGFTMNGHAQTLGKLTSETGSLTQLDSGHLTLTEGGTVSGELAGNGLLTLAGGTLTVANANNALEAKTTIAQGATAILGNTLGLGKGDIELAGALNLQSAAGTLYNNLSETGTVGISSSDVILAGNNASFAGTFAVDTDAALTATAAEQLGSASVDNAGSFTLNTDDNWSLVNQVSGSGTVVKDGSGSLTLGDSAQWTGTTDINAGGLVLGSAESAVTLASQQVNIHENGGLSGFGGVAGNILNNGTLRVGNESLSEASSDIALLSTSVTEPALFTIGGNLENSGEIWLGNTGAAAGNQLVINGDYIGNGGVLNMNTVLDGDGSTTDKLTVKGSTSGTTGVSISNAGGSGAQTLNGIEVIHVDGESAGTFTQNGRIVAGAYDYSLVRGQNDNSGNWYLTSSKTVPDPVNPNPAPDVRPEPGSYTANLAAANTLFNTRLHDRLGETQYTDALTGEQKVTSMWMRQVGGHTNWRDGSGQLKTQSNRYVLQMGGDIARWSSDGMDRLHLGMMAGYGHSSSNTRSSNTGYASDGSVNGYSVGLYGTWYANDATHQGTYLDSWVQYNWFNNRVSGETIDGESYKSHGITASLESGYTHKLGEFTGSKGSLNEWYIQPQAQLTWMGVKADEFRESNGTRVSGEGNGNIQTRLGLRTFLKGHDASDNGKDRQFEPFIEANWIHNTRDFGTQMDGVTIKQSGARNLAEIKTGVEGQLNKNLNLWGNVGVQVGDRGYNDAAAMVGIKYSFK
ncbi:autotransporter family porin [Enterobacter sp. BIGb0383]|uniref:autotransporter outer membrane beta-barrel domain-containing protein n=1 Tax=unclassified Enterobacter TaxID=2608935 RepID=UPI000F482B40|nr:MULTISPECIES: autotransporter outer membrane beta-barrel domain-containing protein [unclassified Enterobacter]ROP61810.1 autotransporter family porin [Enterobacter sp. BIGb0383]ROS11971.1 autotransporter family porin [Enterobacter sp. BIGb0359]